jgi:hypothetical protein
MNTTQRSIYHLNSYADTYRLLCKVDDSLATVFAVLVSIANRDRWFTISEAMLATSIGISRHKVSRAMKCLSGIGTYSRSPKIDERYDHSPFIDNTNARDKVFRLSKAENIAVNKLFSSERTAISWVMDVYNGNFPDVDLNDKYACIPSVGTPIQPAGCSMVPAGKQPLKAHKLPAGSTRVVGIPAGRFTLRGWKSVVNKGGMAIVTPLKVCNPKERLSVCMSELNKDRVSTTQLTNKNEVLTNDLYTSIHTFLSVASVPAIPTVPAPQVANASDITNIAPEIGSSATSQSSTGGTSAVVSTPVEPTYPEAPTKPIECIPAPFKERDYSPDLGLAGEAAKSNMERKQIIGIIDGWNERARKLGLNTLFVTKKERRLDIPLHNVKLRENMLYWLECCEDEWIQLWEVALDRLDNNVCIGKVVPEFKATLDWIFNYASKRGAGIERLLMGNYTTNSDIEHNKLHSQKKGYHVDATTIEEIKNKPSKLKGFKCI